MNHSPLIQLQDATIAVGTRSILKDLNWDLNPGENWVVSGDCGTGKTVFAQFLANKHRLLSGKKAYHLYPGLPVSAQLLQGLKMISFTDTGDLFLNFRSVHYYQQRFNAFDSDGHLTMRGYFEADEASIEAHRDFLESMDIYHLLDLERIKLSSGQTRKMLLAKALMTDPKVLILDNAYIGLDTPSRKVLNDTLQTLVADKRIALVLAGHHRQLPACITHRLHLSAEGTGTQSPVHLPSPTPLPTKTHTSTALEKIRNHFQQQPAQETFDEVIRMEKLNIRYGDKPILKDLTWLVKPGEKWGVYGPNGSGKSTLLSLIYADNPQGYSQPLYLFGQRRGSGESIWDLKAKMGFTSPELHSFFRENPSAQTLVLTGLTDTFLLRRKPRPSEIALMKALFDYFDLAEIKETPYRHLSTGIQRLVWFMRALIKIPPVLLLDEPFQGMDEGLITKCKRLLDEVIQDGQTLVFISHYREEWPGCVTKTMELG